MKRPRLKRIVAMLLFVSLTMLLFSQWNTQPWMEFLSAILFQADDVAYPITAKLGPRMIPLENDNRTWRTHPNFRFTRSILNPGELIEQNTPAVLLLSYMRSGSSWLGDIMFNDQPDVAYMFEPLSPLYMSMYGVVSNQIADNDVIFTINDTFRTFPKEELDSVQWLLSRLLSCDVMSLPLEMYSHHFWKWSRRLFSYAECLNKHMIMMPDGPACSYYVNSICGDRLFLKSTNTSDICFYNLWTKYIEEHGGGSLATSKFNTKARDVQRLLEKFNFSTEIVSKRNVNFAKAFLDYGKCLQKVVPDLAECLPYMMTMCEDYSIVAVKTVRADMSMIRPLLDLHPNLKVIHLYRDPRAVVRSRKTIDWSQGIGQRDDFVRIARTYCERVARDARTRRRLEQRYPHRITDVLYDKLVEEPVSVVSQLHAFLGRTLPRHITKQLIDRKEEQIIYRDRWKRDLSVTEVQAIISVCGNFTRDTHFDWANNYKT